MLLLLLFSHEVVSNSFAAPWTIGSCQAPLSMGFSRQEYWRGLSRPPPGGHPNPGMEPESLIPPALAGGFLTNPRAIWEALLQQQVVSE